MSELDFIEGKLLDNVLKKALQGKCTYINLELKWVLDHVQVSVLKDAVENYLEYSKLYAEWIEFFGKGESNINWSTINILTGDQIGTENIIIRFRGGNTMTTDRPINFSEWMIERAQNNIL